MNKKILAFITSLMTLVVLCGAPAVAFAYDGSVLKKEETVYVVTNANGAQNDVIVSDHLYNDKQLKTISDETTLSDIENVKGDETFKQKGDKVEWAAKGNDIYYQGKTDAEVPVEMNVTYTLDGQSITGPDLQGKSGDVSINIQYTNNGTYNGKTVPFIVLTGLIVTDTSFTNIKVDHGKIVDDGDKQVVVGMAAPGLAQTLDVAEADLGFGDSVKITGTANKFNVEDMMTIVTNSVFEDIDTDMDLDFDDQIKQLNDGAKKLVNGSEALYEGIDELNANVPALTGGVKELKKYSSQLSEGANGIKSYVDGIDAGINGVGGNPGLVDGAKSVVDSIDNSRGTIQTNMSDLDDVSTLIEGLIKDGTISAEEGTKYITTIKTAQGIEGNFADSKSELYVGINKIYQGLLSIQGALKGAGGKPGLKYVSDSVSSGATALDKGVGTLDSKASKLVAGVKQLDDGAEKLSDGIEKLYKDGIKKIVDLYNDDLKGLTNGLDNVMDAGKGYKTFTKLPKNMDGSVKFIYKTTINK